MRHPLVLRRTICSTVLQHIVGNQVDEVFEIADIDLQADVHPIIENRDLGDILSGFCAGEVQQVSVGACERDQHQTDSEKDLAHLSAALQIGCLFHFSLQTYQLVFADSGQGTSRESPGHVGRPRSGVTRTSSQQIVP